MSVTKSATAHPLFDADVFALEAEGGRYVAVRLAPRANDLPPFPLHLAIALDRSSSMSGAPMACALSAAAQMAASLTPSDRLAVVAFDDRVETVWPYGRVRPDLYPALQRVGPRGSTALYDGWLAAARALPRYGRVLLLSDGHANQGRYTDEDDLARQAAFSARHYKIATSTLGIGMGYDEGLMAGMARAGGGNHYFAATPDAIERAVAQERAAMANAALLFASVRVGDDTVEIGHLETGESRWVFFEVRGASVPPVTLRATGPKKRETWVLERPDAFGPDDEAEVAWLVERVARAQDAAARVHDAGSALGAAEEVRAAMLLLLNHRLRDVPPLPGMATFLEDRLTQLRALAKEYDEESAVYERKRSHQSAANLRAPARAYSVEESESRLMVALSAPVEEEWIRDEARYARVAPERWAAWLAVPVVGDVPAVPTIAMSDPRNGYALKEIGDALGERKILPRYASEAEVRGLLA